MTENDAVSRLREELARLQAKVARLEALGGKDEVLADPEFMAEMDELAFYDLDKLPLTITVQEATSAEAEAGEKAWLFQLDVVGYGEDPEEAWENLLLYSLKEPPPCERVPDKDVRLEDEKQPDAPAPGKEEQ